MTLISRNWTGTHTPTLSLGGSVQGRQVDGCSNCFGAYAETDPVTTTADLAATVLDRFGIIPSAEIHDTIDRPWKLSNGSVIPVM